MSAVGSEHTTKTITACVTQPGKHTLVMRHENGLRWSETSSVTMSTVIGGVTHVMSAGKLAVYTQDSYNIWIKYDLDPLYALATQTWKYTTTQPATGWKTASFDDSAWSSLSHTDRPSLTDNVLWFRKTFTLTSTDLNNKHGFEVAVKARAGIIIYVNGSELYRYFIDPSVVEVTTTTNPTGGQLQWYYTTGKKGLLSAGTNIITVAMVDIARTDALTLEFDAYLRLLMDSRDTPRSYKMTTSSTLFNQQFQSPWIVSQATAATIVFSFPTNRAEVINKYCMISNHNDAASDPSAWKISSSNDGSSYTEIDSVTTVFWTTRGAAYCFYMYGNTAPHAHYKLTITAGTGSTASTTYSLAQWNMFFEDLEGVSIPALSFSPSSVVGYVGLALPEVAASSKYYTRYTTTTSLPQGWILNSVNGMIRGSASATVSPFTINVSAQNHKGESASTSITMSVENCGEGRIPFTIELKMLTGAEKCSFKLKQEGTVVVERTTLISNNDIAIPLCQTASVYSIVLGQEEAAGWGGSKVFVKLVDGSYLMSESLSTGWAEKEYAINIQYLISKSQQTWQYIVSSKQPPRNWKEKGVALSSDTATGGSMPAPEASVVVTYYAAEVPIGDTSQFAILDISCRTKAGVVMYVNGMEVTRYNMQEGEVTDMTPATRENAEPQWYKSGVSVQMYEVTGSTVKIAFSLHRWQAVEDENTFDASAIFIMDEMYMMLDGKGWTDPNVTSSGEESSNIFDNNVDTKMFSNTSGLEMQIVWQWDNNRREQINYYAMVNGGDCNKRHPSGWDLYGSNDGVKFTLIVEERGVQFTAYRQQLRLFAATEQPYNMYRLIIKEKANQALTGDGSWCSENNIQIADVFLFAKRLEKYCDRDGTWASAANGQKSIGECPDAQFYTGNTYRLCTDGIFGPALSNCKVLKPESIKYEKDTHAFIVNQAITPITPSILAREFNVTSRKTLPKGLVLDEKTGTISGTPTEARDGETIAYDIVVTNEAGNAYTVLRIAVNEKPTNVLLIVVIVVVVVVVVVAIVIVLVMMNKKNKKKQIQKTTTGKPNKKPAAPKNVKV